MIEINTYGYYIEAFYKKEGIVVGYIDGYVGEGFLHLITGEIYEGYKRQGIMSEMIKYLQKQYPDCELSFHKVTCEGLKFLSSSFPDAKLRARMFSKDFKKVSISEYVKKLGTLDC